MKREILQKPDGSNLFPVTPVATDYITVRLTDGTAYYVAGGGSGGGGDGAINDGVSSAIKATVLDYVNSNPVAVRLTDTNGDYIAPGGGGGTQYAEDTASAAAELLMMAGVVRRDTAASQVDTDGDRTVLLVDASGRLHVNGSAVTQPVSGTFWQATQPVSGPLTDAQLRAVAVPVSGTFWQATQPVSGPLTDAQLRAAAVPVSGTVAVSNAFALAATQTDGTQKSIARGGAKGVTAAADVTSTSIDANTQALDVSVKGSAAVTGTFWQATQPISAASLPLPTGASTEATLATMLTLAGFQARINTLGQKTMAASTPVVLASDQSAIPVTGTFWQATQPVSGTVTANIGTSGSLALDVTLTNGTAKAIQRTAAKGTTAAGDATGSAIDANTHASHVKVKDEGRVRCVVKYHSTSAATADTLQSLTKNLGGTETAATSHGVTAGKRLKITAVKTTVKANAATAAFATFNLRSNAAGATVIGSPILLRFELGLTAATVGSAITEIAECDLEFSGAETLGLSTVVQATTNILSFELIGHEYTP